ncbi:MAG: permease prefix domain 2-containing transporter [Bryobacteraceae bacterium]
MSELLKPPAVAAAILNFFASQPDFSAVVGDISEEFHQRAEKSGANAANRWYWREVFRNAQALTWRELARTPFQTTLIALSCLFAVNVLTSFIWRLVSLSPPIPWGVFIIYQTILLVMGLIGGRLLPGREWALALTFTILSVCSATALRWYFPALRVRFYAPLWALMIFGSLARQGAFWLGCLWIRVHSRSFAATLTAASTPLSSAPRNPPDPW